MYLGAFGPVTVRFPDGHGEVFSSIDPRINAGHIFRSDLSSFYSEQPFLGGTLYDGCPLNIILGQGWIPGQIEALKGAGITPRCLTPGTPEYAAFYPSSESTVVTKTMVPPPAGVATPTVVPVPGTGGGVLMPPFIDQEPPTIDHELGMGMPILIGLGILAVLLLRR